MMMGLSEIIETTSQRFNAAAIQILSNSGLPAYLAEGIVVGLLADIREKKAAELTQELSDQNAKLKKENIELQHKLDKLTEENKIDVLEKSANSDDDKEDD